jgi:hypothetical protein
MRIKLLRVLTAGFALTAVCGVTMLAQAWEFKAPFRAMVHNHQFEAVRMWNEGCELKVRLVFDAPATQYSSSEPARNVHRFRARLRMRDNVMVHSPEFVNRAPGRRAYTFTRDTREGGCWAEQELKLQAVDVEGCRGLGCRVDDFRAAR